MAAAYQKETLPKPLDVVWCKFPFHDRPGFPGLFPHPGLVFATNEYRPGLFSVRVAFGTSKLKPKRRAYDFEVMNAELMAHAGLAQATRFDLDRIPYLPWTDDWFIIQSTDHHTTPVIGRLHERSINRLMAVLKAREKAGLFVPR